ncbi:MAG: cell division protein FtsZ, partial [Candidatus Doudnabacteria bacterium]|nr:cell division protein FtsZ [Candidatus Doudnabacteria bacterium]
EPRRVTPTPQLVQPVQVVQPVPEPPARVEPRRPQFTPISEAPARQATDTDDELDIPAFIRRKMK